MREQLVKLAQQLGIDTLPLSIDEIGAQLAEKIEQDFKALLLQRAKEFRDSSIIQFRYVTILLYIEVNYKELTREAQELLANQIYSHPKYSISINPIYL